MIFLQSELFLVFFFIWDCGHFRHSYLRSVQCDHSSEHLRVKCLHFNCSCWWKEDISFSSFQKQTPSPPPVGLRIFRPTIVWSFANFSNPLKLLPPLSLLCYCAVMKASEANESEFLWNWLLAQSAGHRDSSSLIFILFTLQRGFTSRTRASICCCLLNFPWMLCTPWKKYYIITFPPVLIQATTEVIASYTSSFCPSHTPNHF